jgi:ribonuclease HII
LPDFILEDRLLLPDGASIAGVDEVGRGSLAGPVTAVAAVLDRSRCTVDKLEKIDDSKCVSLKTRQGAMVSINEIAIIGVGFASRKEIDQLNILWASMLAMERAVSDLQKKLTQPLAFALIDGNRLPKLKCPSQAIVKGDSKSFSIAAASIVAKSIRDALMVKMAKQYPKYCWEKNMGYGTRAHLEALKNHGVTDQHRRSFRPVADALE